MRALMIVSILLAGNAFAHEHAASDHDRKPAAATPVEQTAEGAVYGAVLPKRMPAAVMIDTVAADLATHSGKPGAFSGRITQVCQKVGCWLVLTGENGEFARVEMSGHAFSVPKDASGAAVVYGTLREKQHSEADIEHLRKDGAQAPAARELSIEAVSVLIRRAG